jgi:site-specific DNA recombinase
METTMAAPTLARAQRCAIYTRKSTSNARDPEFNSIESQRDICAAYITCQQHREWAKLPETYDDSGQSGATLHRPALQRLLRDIECGAVDIVVIYKIDRLTRSLGDFIRLVAAFDRAHVKFVSVTQAFDTSDSMGRLVLNILLTFAQFERELIADRVRDKVAAIKRRGLINGGKPPYGYDTLDGRLIVNAAEADKVKSIFRRYLEVGICCALFRELKAQGMTGKAHVTRRGDVVGGGPVTQSMIYHMLQNPTYAGRVPHNGDSYPGEHQAIIDDETWGAVQEQMARRKRFGPIPRQPLNLLKRLLRDTQGRRLIIRASGKRMHRYYESEKTPLAAQWGIRRFRMPADDLEELVLATVREALDNREQVRAALRVLGRRGDELHLLPRRAPAACARLDQAEPEQRREMLRALISEGEVSAHNLMLEFRTIEVARFLAWDGIGVFEGDQAGWRSSEPTFTVRRPLDEVRFNRMVEMPVEPIAQERRATPRADLVRLIRTARHAQSAVDAECDVGLNQMAGRFHCSTQRFCRILRLNYLAPDIVAAILVGAQPQGLTCQRLLHGVLPLDWDLQRRMFGFPARSGR